jgi:hypothetical protein
VRADLDAFFKKLFRGSDFSLSYGTDARRLFSVSATASKPFQVSQLVSNLSAAQPA